MRAHEVVDPRVGLEDAHLLDRQDGVDRRPIPAEATAASSIAGDPFDRIAT
jgi:hypothetical protein